MLSRFQWAALFLLGICWLSLTAASAAAAPAAVECELKIVGSPIDNTIKSSSVKCLRGSISAGMHPILVGNLPGISNASCGVPGCLLTICGNTQAVFTNTLVIGMPVTALCVTDNASVTITGNSIIGNNTSTNTKGGGVFARGNATVTITGHSQITGNRAITNGGGGVSCDGNASVTITGDSIIGNNTSTNTNGGGVFAHGNATVTITGHSQITGNRAVNASGGGVSCEGNASITITGNSIIANNTMTNVTGGGMSCAGNAVVTITGHSQITGNRVVNGNGGGLVCIENSTVTISGHSQIASNRVVNGSGGGVLCADKSTVTICGHSQITDNRVVDGLGGGLGCHGNANVTITDHSTIGNNTTNLGGGGVVAGANATVTISGHSQITGNRAVAAGLGGGLMCYDYSSLTITGNSVIANNTCRFSSGSGCGIHVREYCRLDTSRSATITTCDQDVTLSRSVCEVGEIPRGGVCVCCAVHQFSFTLNASTCEPCALHAVCPGGTVIRPQAGYWHSSKWSPQMIRCGWTGACLQGGVCQHGYTGNLCGSCELGFGTTTPLKCNACMKPQVQFGVYALLSFLLVLFISLTVHCTWRDNMQGCSAIRPTDVIKVLIQYLQYLVLVGSVSAPWPQFLQVLFRASSAVFAVASGQTLSLDCWLSHYSTNTSLPLAIQRQLVYFLAPVVVFACVLAIIAMCETAKHWFLRVTQRSHRMIRHSHGAQQSTLVQKLPVTALVTAYYAYPTLVKASLAFFACLPLDDAQKQPYAQFAVLNHTAGYWTYDMDQACFIGWHLKWALSLGLLGVLVFCLGVPIALLCGLWANHTRADEPEFRAHFGFLYRNFRESKVWWEAVWLVQTILLTAISVFHFTLHAYYSTLLLLMVFLLSAGLQTVFKPYALRTLHHIHLTSTACLASTTLGALWLFTVDKDVTIPIQNAHVAIGISVCISNVTFMGWCLYTIFKIGGGSLKAMHTKMSKMLCKWLVAVCCRKVVQRNA